MASLMTFRPVEPLGFSCDEFVENLGQLEVLALFEILLHFMRDVGYWATDHSIPLTATFLLG